MWFFQISGGAYYTTTFVSPADLGFLNLFGFQIFPSIRIDISPKNSMLGYLKLSFVGRNLGIQSLANRELAAGVSYSRQLGEGHSLAVNLDVSNLELNSPQNAGFQALLDTYSLSLSYGF
jgi:hypothetical protein